MFEGFWNNVSNYVRYFVTTLLGIFLNAFSWLQPIFKRRITSIAFISLLVGILVFISFTLRAMLGLSTT